MQATTIRTRKTEIKCMLLSCSLLLFVLYLLSSRIANKIYIIILTLGFIIVYLSISFVIEYYTLIKKPKIVEIEMIEIHSSDNCSICFEPCLNGIQLYCSHYFHKKCIEKWAQTKRTCPNCRLPL